MYMKPIVAFIKQQWLGVFLFLVLILILGKSFFGVSLIGNSYSGSRMYAEPAAISSMGMDMMGKSVSSTSYPIEAPVPPVESQSRKVTTDTTISEQVKDVRSVATELERIAGTYGGYLVTSQVSSPEGAQSGTVVLRVQSSKRSEALDAIKALAVKVVSEEVSASDITDQYTNLVERKAILEATKAQYASIRATAHEISDLVSITRELTAIQQQIDALEGQQKYLDGIAALSRITVYLSTDEYALPYTPDQPWRPEVIVKQAVRSLISNIRSLVTIGIWIGVYSPIVLIVGGALYFIRRKWNRA